MTKTSPQETPILSFVSNNAIGMAFLVATSATVGSLILSEILKLPPCDLCWYQRAFMYPQALILGIALWVNDRTVDKYIIPLSVVGLAIAVYHYLLQLFPRYLPCTTESQACAQKQFELFGFLTIPMMSALAFIMILILMLLARRK